MAILHVVGLRLLSSVFASQLKLGINFASILFYIGYVCVYVSMYVSKRCLYVPVEFPIHCFHNNMNVYVCIPTKTHHTFGECFGLRGKAAWESRWRRIRGHSDLSSFRVKSRSYVVTSLSVCVHKTTGDSRIVKRRIRYLKEF